jgi:hypothetical protein
MFLSESLQSFYFDETKLVIHRMRMRLMKNVFNLFQSFLPTKPIGFSKKFLQSETG